MFIIKKWAYKHENQPQRESRVEKRSNPTAFSKRPLQPQRIACILQIPKSTVSKDILTLREEAKNTIRKYIDERLPEEYERILVGVTSILREAWETSKKEEIYTKEKIQALSLAKECYSMKLELLTNASVVDDAARFIAEHNSNNNGNEGPINSNLAEKEEEPTTETTNKVF